jgi:parallel beta-helix repeat protein
MHSKPLHLLVANVLVAGTSLMSLACGSDDSGSDNGQGSEQLPAGCDKAVSATGTNDVESLQGALIDLKTDQTLCLKPGTYLFDKLITLNGTAGVTVRGTGATPDEVVLDFSAQTGGDDAFTVEADRFTIENLTIKDPPGDGVKVNQSDRPTFRNLKAFYTAGSVAENGAYALYPALSTNVLIEGCDVQGSSDAAIYLGQSTSGVVRNNKAHAAVIGIEVENSEDVEVYGNETWDNTTGFLIVNLPDLPRKVAHRISVHDNDAHENERANFGEGFAAGLPRGSGMVIMGAHHVEVFDNTFEKHSGPAIVIVSWPTFSLLGGLSTTDTEFDQFAETLHIHDNTLTENGQNPQDAFADLGFSTIEDIFWDGVVDETQPPATADDRRLCIQNNGAATFRNLHGVEGVGDPTLQTTDLAPHDCSFPALEAVALPSE